MSDKPKVYGGDHDCELPSGVDLVTAGATFAEWRCPVCRSRWHWRNPERGGWWWDRITLSSRRWRKAERKRIEQRLEEI